jgi:hypothetical protein
MNIKPTEENVDQFVEAAIAKSVADGKAKLARMVEEQRKKHEPKK